jgi:hypothetical protein
MRHIKHVFKLMITWIIVIGITYLFLSLCNWSFSFHIWNGFSRFILGAEAIFFLINVMYEV